jgi:translation initiation factor 4A
MTSENLNEIDVTTFESFDDMGLSENTLRGIYAHGFEKPSAIQKQAIVPIIKGHDIIAQAQSGTGKTGTFAIASLELIDFNILEPQILVLAPTRELAQQHSNVFKIIGNYTTLRVATLIGGTEIREDIENLRNGCHAVIGCPGRIFHMINIGSFKLDKMKLLIIDEADSMLDKGFKEQLYEIFNFGFPDTMKISLFSATLNEDTYAIANKFMRNPVKISLNKDEVTLEGIKQYRINLQKEEHKFGTLIDIYKFISIKQAIIYCNSKSKVITLASELNELKISMIFIYAEMDQKERNKNMKDFRDGKYKILISTDLTARGIDIQQVSLVINYDVPMKRETYIHRIGRSGRMGRKGIALSFVTEREKAQIEDIEAFYVTTIDELPEDVSNIFNI